MDEFETYLEKLSGIDKRSLASGDANLLFPVPLSSKHNSNCWKSIFARDTFLPVLEIGTSNEIRFFMELDSLLPSFSVDVNEIKKSGGFSIIPKQKTKLIVRVDNYQFGELFRSHEQCRDFLGARKVVVPPHFTGFSWEHVSVFFLGRWISLNQKAARELIILLAKECSRPSQRNESGLQENNARLKKLLPFMASHAA